MKVEFSNISKKFLKKCQQEDAKRIIQKIELLSSNPFIPESIKLSGSKDLFQIRVGKYRIIYKIKNENLLITEIGKRGNVYK